MLCGRNDETPQENAKNVRDGKLQTNLARVLLTVVDRHGVWALLCENYPTIVILLSSTIMDKGSFCEKYLVIALLSSSMIGNNEGFCERYITLVNLGNLT